MLQTYGATSVADDALLEMATYQLEIARDAKGADASVDTLLKQNTRTRTLRRWRWS